MVGQKDIGKAALALLFACFASTGSALELEKCNTAAEVVQNWPEVSVSKFTDLGDSIVTYSASFSMIDIAGGIYGSGIYLVHCRSGETLKVMSEVGGLYSKNPERDSKDAEAMLRSFVSGEQKYTFEVARDALEAAGFTASLDTSTNEICACKALYPKDRMGKKPYVYKSGIIENTAAGVNE